MNILRICSNCDRWGSSIEPNEIFLSKRERESALRESWRVDEGIETGTDGGSFAADRNGNCQFKERIAMLHRSQQWALNV
jgi:hypothetical protein